MQKRYLAIAIILLLIIILLFNACQGEEPEVSEADQEAVLAEQENAIPEPTPEPELPSFWIGYVLGNDINIRQAASTAAAIAGQVETGNILQVLNEDIITDASGDTWYEVRFDNKTAYIYSEFLQLDEAKEDDIISYAVVTGIDSILNIRSTPSADGEKVGEAQNGDILTIVEENAGDGTWTQINYANQAAAYVKSDYLQVNSQSLVSLILP